MSTEKFILDHYKIFQKYPSEISVEVRIAQAILESASGSSELAKNAKNLFGIKASAPWNGKSYSKLSGEVINGEYGDYRSNFRAYNSFEDSIKDHAGFFTSTAHRANVAYKKAIDAVSPEEEARALTGVYATDPKYGEKLIDIINKYKLKQYAVNQKEGDNKLTQLRKPIQKITLVNKFARHTNKPKYIVIHYIGAAGQALANANYFYNINRNASAHYFIDKNVTYQVVEDDAGAWHVGDAAGGYQSNKTNWPGGATKNGYKGTGATNYNSVGIEMCQEVVAGKEIIDWPIHETTIEQTLLQTKALMDKYNIPIENVIRHFDVSGKLCPAPWRGQAGSTNWPKWVDFKNRLAKLAKGGTITAPTESKSRYNPKGYPTQAIAAYKVPVQPFLELKVGETGTPRDPLKWFDPEKNVFIVSPNAKELVGKKDKIKEVKAVNIGYSKRAYLLEKAASWVLEQDLEEPRAKFGEGVFANTYKVQKGDYLHKIGEMFKITVDQIKEWNSLESNIIFTGMNLYVTDPKEKIDGKKPNSTDDNGELTPSPEQPKDDGIKTPAIELKEGEMLDWLGNVWIKKNK